MIPCELISSSPDKKWTNKGVLIKVSSTFYLFGIWVVSSNLLLYNDKSSENNLHLLRLKKKTSYFKLHNFSHFIQRNSTYFGGGGGNITNHLVTLLTLQLASVPL